MPERLVLDIPDEIWEQIISLLNNDHHLEPLSLVSKRFLSITNRLKTTLSISEPTIHFLPNLFQRFPNLKHLSFADFIGSKTQDPSFIFNMISKAHFPLESIDLSNLINFPSEGIQSLPRSSLLSVKSLKLSNLAVVSDFDLGVISDLLCNLEELDVSDPNDEYKNHNGSGCLGITDDGVDLLASRVSNLRKVNLSGNYLISDKSVVSLTEKCIKLEEIVVKNCTFVTQNGVCFALHNCACLNSLALLGMDLVAHEISESLCCAKNLSVLDFSYMSVSDGLLFAIAKACIPLRKLTLYHCKDFNFSGVLSLLHAYQSLEYFAMEGVYWVTDRNIIDIAKFLRKAKSVKFNFCSRLTSSAFLTILKNCPCLSCLEMEKTDMGKLEFAVSNAYNQSVKGLILGSNKTMSNDCLEEIASCCPNLELLDVSKCPGISRKGIGEIVRCCSNLRHLQISDCGAIKSLGMDAKLRKLESLRASVSGLNDDGLIMIAKKCPALVYLDVMGCSGVTSRGLREIVKHCERLREINLNWCRDMGHDIVPWMVFSRPSLRKIFPPNGWTSTEKERSLFLRHGCHVCEPDVI